MQTLIIHGRQPVLGRAELESLFGPKNIRPVGKNASLLNVEPASVDFSRLGGMVKFCKVLSELNSTKWDNLEKYLAGNIIHHTLQLPEGKLRIGLSTYGLGVTPKRIQATGLELKKIIRQTGRPVRYVPNVQTALNSAQVLHNKLTQKLGWELVLFRDGNKTILAQSIAVQDIEKYAARDQKRPYRDPRVGMLPPKLAQIIVNLAVGSTPPGNSTEVLDPFCGTGVLLQEASLMGYKIAGSDIDPRMVEYTDKNLLWLAGTNPSPTIHNQDGRYYRLNVADATSFQWTPMSSFIACETYLGRPFSSQPDDKTLGKVIQDCDAIHKKFLRNVARQTKPGFRMCIAVPAWFQNRSSKYENKNFLHLPILDKLEDLGYNRLSFVHADRDDLIYYRPGQIVARELVVLQRT